MSIPNFCIKNVWIADGTAAPLFRGSVIISGDRIEDISMDAPCGLPQENVVNGGGLILSPGFIDVHTHSDLSIFCYPGNFSRLNQGITTEIAGNCGLSPFPLSGKNLEHLQQLYQSYGVELNWQSLPGYRQALEARHPVTRLFSLCGHNTLRGAVLGYENSELRPENLQTMLGLLDSALNDGALGMSAGLLYVPGKFASLEEITALMKVLAAHDAVYTTHLRSESSEVVEALTETLECAARAGLKRVHISHLKTAGKKNFGKLDALLALMEEAQSIGMQVTCDRYPYVESMTQLSVILPSPWDDYDDVKLHKALQNVETRQLVTETLRQSRPPEYWSTLRLAATPHPGYVSKIGKIFADFAVDPAETVVELLTCNTADTTVACRNMSESNMRKIISCSFCMAGSDGNALDSGRGAHPRSFGTAAKFLRLRLEDNAPIETAVRQLTGLAAETFQLPDIGVLKIGKKADMVLFNPEEIDSSASFANPGEAASGINAVFIDGKKVF